MPKISVIVPCFNASPWIRATLKSVAAQRESILEIIAVDDGSTDNTGSIIREGFPNVRLVRTSNQGPSRARNLGTELASGEFIQYLDADDLLAPRKIQTQVEALDRDGADVAYGDWQKLVPTPSGEFRPGDLVAREMRQAPELELFTDFWCPPAAYLFRRSIVDRVGGWRQNLPIIQDARFVLDCALAGGRFVYASGIAARYRVHKSGSVSSCDPIGFRRDCLTNATEVEQWWTEHGGITSDRRRALLRVYGYIARISFEKDRPTFDSACAELERLQPGYVPESPWHLAVLARFAGYRRAESVALAYRKAKSLMHA